MPKDDKTCVVSCGADVAVKLNAAPKATCEEVGRHGTDFGVALKTKINPKCTITYKGSKVNECDPCEHTCYFNVKLDADCDAEVVNTSCGSPGLNYKLKVKVPVKPECKVSNVHKDCDDKPKPKKDDHHHGYAVTKQKQSSNVKLSEKKSNSYIAQLARSESSRKSTIRA